MYTEIVTSGVHYFIRTEYLEHKNIHFTDLHLMELADYALKDDKLIKTRGSLTSIIRQLVNRM